MSPDGTLYVAAVSPATGFHVVPALVEDSHAYDTVEPDGVVVLSVKTTGSPPEQIVWLPLIDAVIVFTLTVSVFEFAEHATLFNVLVATRR